MCVDSTGHFIISTFLICLGIGALLGGVIGGVTAYSNGSNIFWGIATGALLGGAVGAIIGLGGAALTGAVSSLLGKAVTDLFSAVFYGGEFGTWEDYAVAFVFGGISGALGNVISIGGKFANLARGAKFVSDVALRPAANQMVKMGTRGNAFSEQKLVYDIVTRAITFYGTHNVLKGNVLGLDLKIDIGKSFYRATFRSIYPIFRGEA